VPKCIHPLLVPRRSTGPHSQSCHRPEERVIGGRRGRWRPALPLESSRWEQAWGDLLAKAKPGFAIAPTVAVAVAVAVAVDDDIDDDIDLARAAVRPHLSLHVGEWERGETTSTTRS
jgi:hypothetical protein